MIVIAPNELGPVLRGLFSGLTGVKLILAYLAVLATVAFVLTALQPGGPF